MKKIYRYPGVRPFETQDRRLFFGRDQDITNLYQLIRLEKLVVLFARSGYGKSSLLNAGIIPRFLENKGKDENRYRPVPVRFGAYLEGRLPSPLERTIEALSQHLPVNPESQFLEDLCKDPENNLWCACKRRQTPDQEHILFLFDQFEEFFTYPEEQQNAFKYELAEALYRALPQDIRDASEDCSEAQFSFLARPLDIKAVLAIRSDRLHYLHSMKDALPGILYRSYELQALSRQQARSAIIEPAQLDTADHDQQEATTFFSPRFRYSPEAVLQMLDALSAGAQGTSKGIEAFQLQLLCRRLEDEVAKGNIKDRDGDGEPDIQPGDLPDPGKIYESYYRTLLHDLEPAQRNAARLVIEEGLLFENPETGGFRRLSVDGAALEQRFAKQGVDQELLQILEQTFLVRREPNTTGGFNYEISHDTLLPPIAHSRTSRRQAERRIETEAEIRKAKAKMEEDFKRKEQQAALQNQLEVSRKGRKLNFWWGVVATLLTVVAVFLFYQSEKANRQVARSQQEATEQMSLALQSNLDRNLSSVETFLMVGDEPSNAMAQQALDSCWSIFNNPQLVLPADDRQDYQERLEGYQQYIEEYVPKVEQQ